MSTTPDSGDSTDDGTPTLPGVDRPGGLDRERLFELLSNRRRRFVMHYLKRHPDERIDMGTLSTQVAAWEHDVSPDQLGYDQRKTVHTALYQHHAPKLAEAGVAEYDASRGEITLTDAGERVDLYLEAVGDREVSWAMYFVMLSALGGLLALGDVAGVAPFSRVADAAWGPVVAIGFLVSSSVFAYDMRSHMRLGVDGPPPEVSAERDGDSDRSRGGLL